MKKKHLIPIASLVIILSLLFALLKTNSNLRQVKGNLFKEKSQKDSLLYVLNVYNMKSTADEDFLDKLSQAAWSDSYFSSNQENIDVLNIFPWVVEKRTNQENKLRQIFQQKENAILDLETGLKSRNNNLDSLNEILNFLVSRYNEKIQYSDKLTDSIMVYNAQLIELEERFKNSINVLEFKKDGNTIYYLGEKENGKANGYGVGMWSTGSTYKGEWKDNHRHGKGIYIWKDGEYYEGDFFEGVRTGKGKYVWKDKSYYVGNWEANRRSGFGVIYYPNGTVQYQGNWVNDKFKQSQTAIADSLFIDTEVNN